MTSGKRCKGRRCFVDYFSTRSGVGWSSLAKSRVQFITWRGKRERENEKKEKTERGRGGRCRRGREGELRGGGGEEGGRGLKGEREGRKSRPRNVEKKKKPARR